VKTLLAWIVTAVAIAAVLIVAGDPPYWLQRFGFESHAGAEMPLTSHSPRAVIPGSAQPPAPHESPETQQLNVDALQSAADYAEKQHSRALIVTRHGYFVFERYWQGSDLNTVIASSGLGRVLAALATGVALSDRKIAWPEEPLGYLVPAWNKDRRGAVTVRNVLQLSSGLGSPGAPPGQRWQDQESDPDLLAHTLQTVTGMPYTEYLSESIWKRIGAADASIWLDPSDHSPHVDTGFFARQGDWLRVGELLLGNGNYQGDEVLLPRWIPELLKPSRTNSDYGSYFHLGAHTAPRMTPYLTPDVYVVEGGGNRMWLVPSMQIAILRTGGPVGADWDDGRIPNLIVNGAHDFVPAAARPGSDLLRQLVPNH
jgi:CubicO group peptidase (beta-lactamase class C family)